ncbi:MAG: hypothetical protein II060_08550, partial [Bacteroidales bacterium]|nr:hypothetical protein [Bacteroidales bacterium]
VRTITRYGTWSVILFNCAESPIETFSIGDYSLRFVKEFRINEFTSNVPYAVRSVLRNDQKDKNKKNIVSTPI